MGFLPIWALASGLGAGDLLLRQGCAMDGLICSNDLYVLHGMGRVHHRL